MPYSRHLTYVACAGLLLLSTTHVSAQSAAPSGPEASPPPPPPVSARSVTAPPVTAPPVTAPRVTAPPTVPGATAPLTAPPPPPGSIPTRPVVAYAPQVAYADPLTVTVTLESTEPGVTLGLFPRGASVESSRPIMHCVDRCTAQVKPGRYKFAVAGNDDVVGGSRDVVIDANVHLLIDPDMVEHRSVGLAMGVGGIALMFYGIYSMLHSIDYDDRRGRNSVDDSELARGAYSLLASLAIIPVGWVMYGTSFKPEWEAIYSDEAKTKPRFNLGFAPVKEGGILGATLSF